MRPNNPTKSKDMFLKVLGLILTGCFIAVVFVFMRSKKNDQHDGSLSFLKPPPPDQPSTHEGLHFIKKGNKWGLADGADITVIPFKYDSVTTGDDNRSLASEGSYVVLKSRWGFIDGSGREVIPPKYIELGAFNTRGVAWYVSENGDGLINAKGEELQVPDFDYVESDNRGFRIRKGNLWGLLDAYGNSKLPTTYSSISEENGSLALTKDGSHGLADQQGNLILPCEFEQIKPVGDRFLVTKGGERGLYDEQGKEILPCEYGFIIPIDNGDYYYVFKNGRSGYVDLQGNELVPCEYQIAKMEGAGYAKIEHIGLIGWYDINAHAMAIPLQYDFVWGKFESKDDVVKVRKPTGEVVRIDYYGREVNGKSLKDYYKQLVN